ncbi:MAG: 1-deoxy-D-xylulose-5-phosphate reductoisomerase [Paludibacteraceae bacterium]|nr:1-deoxy-D-xylulose-5-phosphate reductoisomerase [Paludibacteraceae bacterium]
MKLAILGSTGSIGCQTLDVVKWHPDRYEVYALVANNSAEKLIAQAREFQPEVVVINNYAHYEKVKEALSDQQIKVFAGSEAIDQVVGMKCVDTVVTAMVGYAGLRSTIAAIKAGKRIALANKETLVVAGEMITELAAKYHAAIVPVDSEHGAIFQCLVGEKDKEVEKLIITASGGPFRKMGIEELRHVKAADALKHPTWKMGPKITIDSASLMNKGFEVMEARWLFGVTADRIDVVVHPQSIIHSMVQFVDGSIKAQMGTPDMRLPIQYALSYPTRIDSKIERMDFGVVNNLTFEKPDIERFKNLGLAFEALKRGGNVPCVLNAANEVVVAAFLEDRIGFLEMSEVIENVIGRMAYIEKPTYEEYVACDAETRIITSEYIK